MRFRFSEIYFCFTLFLFALFSPTAILAQSIQDGFYDGGKDSPGRDVMRKCTIMQAIYEIDSHYRTKHEINSIVDAALKLPKSELLLAIAMVESSFDNIIKQTKRERSFGIGQIRPSIWANRLISAGIINRSVDLLDPIKNLKSINFIVDHLDKRTAGNIYHVLTAYNQGEGQAKKMPNDKCSTKYCNKVLSTYLKLLG